MSFGNPIAKIRKMKKAGLGLLRISIITGLCGICLASARAQNDDTAAMKRINPRLGLPLRIDNERVAANGIRRLDGKHILLYTDVRDRGEIDELVAVFDQAVNQWCQYFSVEPNRAESWRMRCFLIEDRSRFKAAGLTPDDLPDFLAGYQRGHEIWIYLQLGNYYTRHLLLHEGTHAFMDWFLNGLGSAWYAEGIAELIGLHRWENGSLQLNYELRDRNEAEYWGRIKIIRREYGEGITMSLDDVLNIPQTDFREVRSYAWAWAACEFLAHHQNSQQVFATLFQTVNQPSNQFNATLKKSLQADWQILNRDWFLYISEMEYGYDIRKGRLFSATPIKTDDGKSQFQIRADHAWQATSFRVKPGDRLRITCSSRFQVGKTDQPWPCEANGVTLEYYQGRPLGLLLAGVLGSADDSTKDGIAGLLKPFAVGQDSIIEISADGVLCLRINESPARMHDNQGVLEVVVEKLE